MRQNEEQAQVGWLGLATIWFGGMISVPSLLIGSTLIAGLPFQDVLIAGAIGFAVVCTFMSLESVAAVDERRDTVSLATSSFGFSGAKVVVGLALGVSLLGWFGVQSGIAGGSFAKIAGISFGWQVSPAAASMVLGLLMMLTAVFGFKYLKWLNFVAVPCKVLLVVYAVIGALTWQSAGISLSFLPLVLVGLAAGRWLMKRVNRALFSAVCMRVDMVLVTIGLAVTVTSSGWVPRSVAWSSALLFALGLHVWARLRARRSNLISA